MPQPTDPEHVEQPAPDPASGPVSLSLAEAMRLLGVMPDDTARLSEVELTQTPEDEVCRPTLASGGEASGGRGVTYPVTPLGHNAEGISGERPIRAKKGVRDRSAGRGKSVRMLSTKETAEELGISVDTVYEMICKGRLRHVRIGPRCFRIDRRWIDAFIEQESQGGESR
jgi:excisionase family DNA binding protein